MGKLELILYASLIAGTLAAVLITAITGYKVNPVVIVACLGLELMLVGSAVL